MKFSRFLTIGSALILTLFVSGCSLLGEDKNSGMEVKLTITNPGGYSVPSMYLMWGDYESDNADGEKEVSGPTFPYTTSLKGCSECEYFLVMVFDGYDDLIGLGTINTADGADELTVALYDEFDDDDSSGPSAPGGIDWEGPTALAGGAARGSAVAFPEFLHLYTGTLANEGDATWYSFDTVDGTDYRVYWDDDYSGSGNYSSDVEVYAYDSLGTPISNKDSGYNTPLTITGDGETVYIEVVAEYDPGTYAIGVVDSSASLSVKPTLSAAPKRSPKWSPKK
jgi:hypothetical protein